MHVQVSSGDIVILGSDGLWDNIAIPDISSLVLQEVKNGSRPSKIAQKLLGEPSDSGPPPLLGSHLL